MLLGLTAGRQADEIVLALKIFKILWRGNLEALGLFERRYSILISITNVVVGFCVLIFIMLFINKRIFREPYISLSIPTIKY